MIPSRKPGGMQSAFQKEIEAAFSELIHTPWQKKEYAAWHPAIDVVEQSDCFLLIADLPGVDPASIKLDIEEHRAILCGEREIRIIAEQGNRLILERAAGRFCRTIEFPVAVDVSALKVRYENGIYEATIPKSSKQ